MARVHMVTFGGKTQSLTAWERDTKIAGTTLRRRLRLGWTVERALTEQVTGPGPSVGYKRTQPRKMLHGATQGKTLDPTFVSWRSMLDRCYAPKTAHYENYGGRGIRVHEAWRKSFAAFLEHTGPRPKGTTLDRFPDQNGNYEPGNVRWATPKEQAANKRNNVWLERNGERLILSEWARRLGVSPQTLSRRLRNPRLTVEQAFENVDRRFR
jgi:hypothetical protein